MSEYQVLTFVAAFAFIYSLIASRLEKTSVNGALVYVAVVMVIGEKLPGNDTIVAVVMWTIVLSVILHGLSANLLASAYGERVGDAEI